MTYFSGATKLMAIAIFAMLAASASAQQWIATVPVGSGPFLIAKNSRLNKIYVGDTFENTIRVIDGVTFNSTTIPIPVAPFFMVVDEERNKIYASNNGAGIVMVIDGSTNEVRQLSAPFASLMAVNSVTNKIYVISYPNLVVIDGATLSTTTIPLPHGNAGGLAINEVTNKIYVTEYEISKLSIIDGQTNLLTTVDVPSYPAPVVVNSYTNKLYVFGLTTITEIDGATLDMRTVQAPYSVRNPILNYRNNRIYDVGTLATALLIVDSRTLSSTMVQLPRNAGPYTTLDLISDIMYIPYSYFEESGVLAVNGGTHTVVDVHTGGEPWAITADPMTHRIYATDVNNHAVLVFAGNSSATALHFVPATPCRVVDTRGPNGPFGGPPIQGGSRRDFPLAQGSCGIPLTAAAVSLNVTAVPHGRLGYLTLWPSGADQPQVSTLNSVDGRVKANAAIVPTGVFAGVSVYASDTTDVILDINGYFSSSSSTTELVFYPLTSCRAIDTRSTDPPYLTGGQERDFPLLGACGIPSSAQAYSLNVTALPHGPLGYLTVWPEGQPQPLVSTLNAPTGTATANAALVTGGVDGEIAVYPSADTDLLVDVNGYFAPPSPGGLLLYPVQPCRILDTRQGRGRFSGTILVDVYDSGCGFRHADALVLNATAVPQGHLTYLTIWPTTQLQPGTSTLNAMDGVITSNMLIVQDIDGWLNAFASNPTHLILDGFSYFAP